MSLSSRSYTSLPRILQIKNLLSNIGYSFHNSVIKNGPIQDRIESKLKSKLDPLNLDVQNESSMHNVPRGSETHFRVVIVSKKFDGLNALQRHRKVVKVLREEFQNIHAMAIEAYTPIQWEMDLNGKSDCRSPRCLGGSKSTK
ncbi:DNA-binding transcriptional regulator BolA [Dermatophagoides farinae]|uniref:DNA-binding transcriptional regulator BolA n=1 Tax=Dermatophagoides farinae TaxID=6954 RepID=UPI003F5ED93D